MRKQANLSLLLFFLSFVFISVIPVSSLGETCFERFRKPKAKYCNQHISYLINDVMHRIGEAELEEMLVEMIAWKGGNQKGSVEALFCLSDLSNKAFSPQVMLIKFNPRCQHDGYVYKITNHKTWLQQHFWIECYKDTHRHAKRLWEEGGKKGIPPRKRRDACRDMP